MPDMDGLEAEDPGGTPAADSRYRVAAYGERNLLGRGLEAGAKGYILKEAPHQTLLRAIEKVASGEGYVDPALMPALLTRAGGDARARDPLLAYGMSNADVAAKLFISQETVKSHVRHILAKLEADTRTHAVAIALRESIIDPMRLRGERGRLGPQLVRGILVACTVGAALVGALGLAFGEAAVAGRRGSSPRPPSSEPSRST